MKPYLLITFLFIPAFLLAQASEMLVTYQTDTISSYYPDDSTRNNPYMKDMCVLDVYYPVGKKDFPNRGIAVVGVGYRLAPNVKAINCIKDAAAATAWVFNHIEDYGGNKNLIFVSGMSAGGYLTYMIGLDKSYLASHTIDANHIAGLIPFSGHAITHFTVRKEMGIPGHQPIIDQMAPLYHVRPDASPLLIITGDRNLEMLGRYEENAYMMRMMKVAGHKNVKLYELDGNDHGQMLYPAFPLLLREVEALTAASNNKK